MTDNSKKKELFLQTLTRAYNHQKYVRFLQELLNDVQMVAPTRFNKEYSSLSGIIAGHYHIGNYKGADGKKMALFAVQLQNKGNVENARSSQRAFIKTLLDNSGCDGALAAFFTMEKDASGQERPSDKWRLSFIRMEYGFADGKLSTKLTPAKRYSYLVGEGEPCHTAQERLYGMFVQDEVNPGLAELEEAFSVETVTKQFFNDYKEKYLAVKEYLETTPDFMAEAKRCGFTSEQFTKKLMGQIVFLYFVQKKGWLGVSVFPVRLTEKAYKSALFRNAKAHNIVENVYSQPNGDGISFINREALFALSDEDAKFLSTLVKGKSWGEGPKNFMRALYESCVKQGRNYFDDYLEPLFYEALNVDRGESGFYARFHCRVPFLNGGLFEQLDNYDWVNSDFHIPNDMFSNRDTKGEDEADGILDIFDRYNFTMAEDEPMEREVAIDPEMLGKVFENLLDVKDRKSKGAFYTPREIVHYMCQESLINYLTTTTGIEEADIRKFILYGEYFRDNDCLKTKEVIKNGKKSHTVDKARELEMPESIFSFKQGVNRLKELDALLANVKIADPAVGSGAFLLGLLNEIVKARQTLTAYMTIEMNSFERFNFYAYGRKAYDLKVNTIKNCLFACDLEPSATDITKLRLWLSIVIDDELVKQDDSEGLYDAHTEPRPLPNLDCNIICGNSLMDEFEGIKLITESSILNNQAATGMDSFYQAGFDNMLQELIKLQDELYFTKQHETKQEIKKKIHDIYDRIILHQLECNPTAVEKYKEVKDLAQQPFILWQLYFPKVFKEKQGFDIVIGNPPYIGEEGHKYLFQEIANTNFGSQYYIGKMDFWYFFVSKGINILHNQGSLSFIAPNNWMSTAGGKKMRAHIAQEMKIKQLVTFNNVMIFESASQQTMVFLLEKEKPVSEYSLDYKEIGNQQLDAKDLQKFLDGDDIGKHYVSVYDPEKQANGESIQFLNTQIDAVIKKIKGGDRFYLEKNEILNGIHPHHASVTKKMLAILPDSVNVGDGIFVLSNDEVNRLNLPNNEHTLLRPYYDTKNIRRYYFDTENKYQIIYTTSDFKDASMMDDYPILKKHLDFYAKVITSDNKPYGLHRARQSEFFDNPSIASLRKCSTPTFAYLNKQAYLTAEWYLIKTKRLNMVYLTCLFNSSLVKFWLLKMGKMQGNIFQIDKEPLLNIPIVSPSSSGESEIIELHNKLTSMMLANNNSIIVDIEKRIDEIIYKEYELSDNDIAVIKDELMAWGN